ncbi:RING finger protein 37 isoform X3 [Hoplias malabaricus]
MVVNLCLPHFQTTVHCNKLCADGYDVSNLLSDDPVTRRRGFKLEYFLRPPLHVTLHFKVRVELCRVDIELWPCGMDQGSVTRRLEILTCSDGVSKTSEQAQENGQFKLVGRCDLKDDVLACLKHPNFKLRAPFLYPPPDPPAHAKKLELWSRGMQSLNSVAQLRITVPFGGAASALGIKSVAVWGIPARSCSPTELETFQKALLDNLEKKNQTFPLVSMVSTSSKPPRPNPVSSETPIPQEFLDPLTQELMVLPMILPSGMVVDNSTLEEYQKQEATWGRLPNDPFTGVSFTKDSKPIPNPLLKSRIDSLILRTGCTRVGSRKGLPNKPQPSKLTTLSNTERTPCSAELVSIQQHTRLNETEIHSTVSVEKLQKDIINRDNQSRITDSNVHPRNCVERQRFTQGPVAETCSIRRENLQHGTKRKFQSDTGTCSTSTYSSLLNKMPKTDASLILPTADSSQSSHEQRLSDSLDQALRSALHGLPTYTSQSKPEPQTTSGESRCGLCSCSLTVYPTSPAAYSLLCGHLLCRSCLQHEHPPNSQRLPITCPTCKARASPSTITRVHH